MALMESGVDVGFKDKWIGTEKSLTEEQEKYRELLMKLTVKREFWCLVVGGTKGNGKSYMAQVAVNTFNDAGRRTGGYYITQPLLEAELRMEQSKTFLKYAKCPLLVIDELSDRPNDWTEFIKTNIESILIERHRQGLPTEIIGNVDLKRVREMFDVRIRDRLREGVIHPMTGPSLRRDYGTEK